MGGKNTNTCCSSFSSNILGNTAHLRSFIYLDLLDLAVSVIMALRDPAPDSFFCVCPAGWGSVAYCGRAEKDPRGAHEAGAGPAEAAEGGAENHPRQGQVQAQALLHPEGHRIRLLPLRPQVIPLPHPAPFSSSSSSFSPTPPPLWNARFVLEVLKEGGAQPAC